jgi:hypothetical protein
MVGALASPVSSQRQSAIEAADAVAIKLLDLVTNRYHAGVVRRTSQYGVQVEVPATSKLRPGQRIRCILAGRNAGVLPRKDMRRANVLHVEAPRGATNLLLELAFMDDPTAS